MKAYKKVSLLILILLLALLSLGASKCSWFIDEDTVAGSSAPLASALSNLNAIAVSHTQINLTWQDNSNNEESVKIERRTELGTYVEIATVGANVTGYADNSLTIATTFYYRVRAYNTNGYSMYSNVASATTDGYDVGMYNSIAVDTNNKVHISYYDESHQALKYTTNASGSWVTSTIDSAENVGSIVVTGTGTTQVHISYYDGTNGGLKYATNASGSWVTSTIDSIAGVGPIAVDTNNKVHIAYKEGDDFKHVTNITGTWVITTIDSGSCGYGNSISVDPANKVHISYFDVNAGDGLKYATDISGSWVITTVDTSSFVGGVWDTSIALDSNNKVHISYDDSSPGGSNCYVKYATNASGSWVISPTDSAGTRCPSIVVDGNNKVHISYFNYGLNMAALKYATDVSGTWVTDTIDDTNEPVRYTSIARDTNNKIHISYYDYLNKDLKYATNASGAWVISTVDQ